jgi:hypothetical protein
MTTPSETVQAAQRLLEERALRGPRLPDRFSEAFMRFMAFMSEEGFVEDYLEPAADHLLSLVRLQQTMKATRVTDFNLYTSPQQPDTGPDRAAYLARWANAPAEATHLTEDVDGACVWRSIEASLSADGQFWGGGWITYAGNSLLGRVACEPRPTPAVDPERAAYLKRWKGAPKWALYLIELEVGSAWWLEAMPLCVWPGSFAHTGRSEHAGMRLLGSARIEPRPEVEP